MKLFIKLEDEDSIVIIADTIEEAIDLLFGNHDGEILDTSEFYAQERGAIATYQYIRSNIREWLYEYEIKNHHVYNQGQR